MNVHSFLQLLPVCAALFLFAAHAEEPPALRWEPLHEPGGGGRIVSLAIDPNDVRHIVAGGDMLGAAVSFDGGDSWTPCQGLPCYEMCTPTFRPGRQGEIWFGSCSGPLRSVDGGRTWQERRNGMPPSASSRYTAVIETVLFDPANSERLLAFGGSSRHWTQCDIFGSIWESVDDGTSWRRLGTLTSDGFVHEALKGANITRAFFSPDGILHIVADKIGWWQSPDGGRTWRRHLADGFVGPVTSVTVHPKDPKIVWVATGSSLAADGKTRIPGGIFKSTDSGVTFVSSENGLDKCHNNDQNRASRYDDVAISPAAPDELYVCDQSWNHNVVFKSTDGGKNWRPIAMRGNVGKTGAFRVETATFAGLSLRLVAAEGASGIVYGFNSEYILRTLDGGATWEDVTAYRPIPARPDCWRGRGWNGWCSKDFAFNPWRKGQSVALAMDAGRGWLSDDGLYSWRYTMGQTSPWLGGQSVGFSRDGHIYITTGQNGGQNGIQHSDDFGATWTTLSGATHGLPNTGWNGTGSYGGIYVHPEDGRRAWAVLKGSLIATENGGNNWTHVPDIDGASQIAADPSKSGRFYIRTRKGVLVTEDGKSFQNIGFESDDTRSCINCDARGRVLLCQWRRGRTGLWRYNPAESRWTRLLDESHAFECNADPSDPTRLLLVTADDPYYDRATGHGIWISVDDGASWSPANDGLPILRLTACAFDPFDPETVVVGTSGMGFFRARWPKSHRPAGTRRFTPGPKDIVVKPN